MSKFKLVFINRSNIESYYLPKWDKLPVLEQDIKSVIPCIVNHRERKGFYAKFTASSVVTVYGSNIKKKENKLA